MDIKTILCPTDFSDASDRALHDAVQLAKSLNAQVRVVHVFQRPVGIALEGAPVTMEAASQFLEEAHREAGRALEKMRTRWAAKGVELDVELIEGNPFAAIVEESKRAQMIVMATHGRSGFQRFILGSVAERVVRTAHCPVLCLPMTELEKKEG